jgi:PAS domain S-box-containing protein
MKDTTLNISILFVEDEQEARKNISEIISRRATDFFVAENASEALEIYKKHKPDLVLSDIQMPGMDGLQMVEKIKQINPQVKIIMMTAFTDTNYLLKSIDLQIDGYIIKPIRTEKLLSTIKKQTDIILAKKKIQEQEQELIESEEKYRLLTETLKDVVVKISPTGEVLYVSPAIEKFSGYSAEQETGNYISKYFANKDEFKKALVLIKEVIRNKNGGTFEFLFVPANRKPFPVEISYIPLLKNNEVEAFQFVMRDTTERKKAEDAIRQQNLQLQERNEELDAFSHTVAHDLKNPLGIIMSFADLLFEDYSKLSNDEILNYLSIIISDGKKTQQIINNLLLFASVRKAEINTEELNMGEIVAGSINSLTAISEKNNAEIKFPETWPTAFGYAPWVEEVWTNFLNNAIKYGGTPPLIEIGTDTGNAENIPKGMLRFWVRDNGPGISAGNQKLLFKKFERLDQVKTEGHGLGLSIVRRIIEKLGGQVGVESEQGKGSLFYFTLPSASNALPETQNLPVRRSFSKGGKLKTRLSAEALAKEENPKLETHEAKQSLSLWTTRSKPVWARMGNLKVLIAEDEEYADTHLSIIIKKLSKEIFHTITGSEAVEICRNNPDIDLILMDIRMPEMSGYEATRKIREFNKDVIIIAQTAYALHGDREKSLEAGCNDYISKPINKEKLMEMIRQYLGNR